MSNSPQDNWAYCRTIIMCLQTKQITRAEDRSKQAQHRSWILAGGGINMRCAANVRQQRIISLIHTEGNVNVTELCEEFGVSKATVRRDLATLSARGAIQRTWGGATAPEQSDRGPKWMQPSDDPYKAQKARIGRAAAKLVKPGQTVSLECGTTVFEVCRSLARVGCLCVVTHCIKTAYHLNNYGKCSSVNLVGGIVHRDTRLYGPLTTFNLRQFAVDVAFIGAYGVSTEYGITDEDPLAAEIKRSLIERAKHVVLVLDERKIGIHQPIIAAPLTDIHTLVTTKEATNSNPEFLDTLTAQGTEVITC